MKRPTISDIARQAGRVQGAPSRTRSTASPASPRRPASASSPSPRRSASTRTAPPGRCPAPRPRRSAWPCAGRPGPSGLEPFFMELISGVEAELSARSYALTLQVVPDPDAEVAVYRRWWGERRVDGVLVCDLRDGRRPHPGAGAAAAAGRGDRRARAHRSTAQRLVRRRGARSSRRWSTWTRSGTGASPGSAACPSCCTPRSAPRRSRRSATGSGSTRRSRCRPTTPARRAPGPPAGC